MQMAQLIGPSYMDRREFTSQFLRLRLQMVGTTSQNYSIHPNKRPLGPCCRNWILMELPSGLDYFESPQMMFLLKSFLRMQTEARFWVERFLPLLREKESC